MKFGKEIQILSANSWSQFYLDYKGLKKIINSLAKGRPLDAAALAAVHRPIPAPHIDGQNPPYILESPSSESDLLQAHKASFFFKLERELEKINAFYLQKEGEIKVRLRTLIDKRKSIQATSKGRLTRSSSAFVALWEGFKHFEQDLSRLQAFIEINATGFRKILKKWDKRSKSTTKEMYLARQIEVQPCFNRQFMSELHDAVSINTAKLETLVEAPTLAVEQLDTNADIAPGSSDQQTRILDDHHNLTDSEPEAIEETEYALQQAIANNDTHLISQTLTPLCNRPTLSTEYVSRLSRIVWQAALYSRLIPTDLLNFRFIDDINGRTPLHEASLAGRTDLVDLSIARNLDVAASDAYGRTPLHYAAMKGHTLIVQTLLALQSDATSKDLDGLTPAIYAIINGHLAIVQLFLQAGAFNNESSTSSDQLRPLNLACQHGRPEIVALLLQNGFVVKADLGGFYPQHIAAKSGQADCLRVLLQSGQANINETDKYSNWTPLFHAVGRKLDCVQTLIDAGCDLNVTDDAGRTPLHYAAWQGHIACVNLLLQAGARYAPILASATSPEGPGSAKSRSSDGIDDLEMDLIPSLSLPPPIMPFRTYGHNYLDGRALVLVSLGHSTSNNAASTAIASPVRLYAMTNHEQTSMKLVLTCKPDPLAIPYNIIFPLSNEREVYTFQVDSFDKFSLDFDLYPTFGSRILGRATALHAAFNKLLSLDSLTIPLFDHQLRTVGEVDFELSLIKPFQAAALAPSGQLNTYWKASQPASSSQAAPIVTASSLTGDYIRCVVQLSKDGVPFCYPFWPLPIEGMEVYVSQMTSAQLEGLAVRQDLALNEDKIQGLERTEQWYQAIQGSLITLEQLLQILPSRFGINLELRYPTASDERRLGLTNTIDLNAAADSVLTLAYSFSNQTQLIGGVETETQRRIVLSSYNPVVCTALNWKQPNYPVFFASFCGLSRTGTVNQIVPANRTEDDRRCTSIKEAVAFAKANNLLGVVFNSALLNQVPSLTEAIKEQGLFLVASGSNTVKGVDGCVTDGIWHLA